MITRLHLFYPPDIDLSLVCWRPPTPEVIFHLPVPLRNMCARHGVISLSVTCWSLRHSFLQLDEKFHVYLLFSVQRLFLSAHSWTTSKRGSVRKSTRKKMFSGRRKLRLVMYSQDYMLDDNSICSFLFHP